MGDPRYQFADPQGHDCVIPRNGPDHAAALVAAMTPEERARVAKALNDALAPTFEAARKAFAAIGEQMNRTVAAFRPLVPYLDAHRAARRERIRRMHSRYPHRRRPRRG